MTVKTTRKLTFVPVCERQTELALRSAKSTNPLFLATGGDLVQPVYQPAKGNSSQNSKGNTLCNVTKEQRVKQNLLVLNLFKDPGVEMANKAKYSNAKALQCTEKHCLAVTILINLQDCLRPGNTYTYCKQLFNNFSTVTVSFLRGSCLETKETHKEESEPTKFLPCCPWRRHSPADRQPELTSPASLLFTGELSKSKGTTVSEPALSSHQRSESRSETKPCTFSCSRVTQ